MNRRNLSLASAGRRAGAGSGVAAVRGRPAGADRKAAGARAGRRAAFTLIELLVIAAIISLLMTMLLPVLRRAKELARRSICAGNVKSLVLSMGVYASQNASQSTGVWFDMDRAAGG